MRLYGLLLVFTVASCVSACASIDLLPATPADVRPLAGRFEQGYWPRYTEVAKLRSVTKDRVFEAARKALAASDFSVTRDDPQNSVLMGERGMTLFYWNVVAGVYITQENEDVAVKVVSVGSKDIGFIELQPNPFSVRLLQAIQRELAR